MQITSQWSLSADAKPMDRSMLLVLPLAFHTDEQGNLLVESQGLNGLKCWLNHFSPLTLAAPVRPIDEQSKMGNATWVPVPESYYQKGLKLVALPWGYHPSKHFKHVKQVRHQLADLLDQHRYLQCGIGGCTFGDWAAVAARLAIKRNRTYAVHTDWITHQVYQHNAKSMGLRKRLRAMIEGKFMWFAEKKIINHSTLGLFHGADTYEGYRSWCKHPFMIHDAQVQPSELATMDRVEAKIQSVDAQRPLRIVYAGRAISMKGPDHWIKALSIARDAGVNFTAQWFGYGDQIDNMQKQINDTDLADRVTLPGHLEGRMAMMDAIFDADMLLFCHMTPESPRILIESMGQATPIVGYGSNYSEELIHKGGGELVTIGAFNELAQRVIALDQDRENLRKMMHEARIRCDELTDVRVFGERAELIEKYLG